MLKNEYDGEGIFSDVFEKVTRQKFKGEKHIPLYTEEGFKVANYSGPGTNLETRLKSNDPELREPITLTDTTAKAHDLRYALAENFDDIRKADNKMISKLQEIERDGLDYKINTKIVKNAMKAKRFFEDITKIRGTFSGLSKDGKKQSQLSNEEKELYKNALLKLERRGYGMIKKKRLPDEALSDTFINDYLKNSKSFIGCFPKDKLKNIKINKKKNMSCIVNLDDSTGPGSHWIVILYHPKLPHSYYIDSFGLKPAVDIVKFLKKYNKPIYYNDKNIQSIDSVRCGSFTVDIIEFFDKNFLPSEIMNTYTPYPSAFNEEKALNPNF